MNQPTDMNKDLWVELFKEAGVTEPMMHKWHALYEAKHPQSHQDFLEWLGLPETEIAGIRQQAR